MSSASSLGSAQSGRLSHTGSGRRRTTSLSATSPTVITTDKVRPDWHQKLAAARAHTARRSAAATALHTAAYLMGNRQESDGRALGAFGRRGILRRTSGTDSSSGPNSSQLNMLAMMTERYAASGAARGEDSEPTMTPGPRGSSRRNRVDDLEDMMMMEAIRLSLASEDDRRRREEKDAKKDAKKKEKENKKAEKAARKAGIYPSSANQSTSNIDNALGDRPVSQGDPTSIAGKGKAAQLNNTVQSFQSSTGSASITTGDPQEHLERARAQILPSDPAMSFPYSSSPYRPSHLRTLSNASSTASSVEGSNPASLRMDRHGQNPSPDISPNASGINIPSTVSAQDTYISGTPPGGGAGMEPMFNFRSLAAMVGDDGDAKDETHEGLASEEDAHGSHQEGSLASTNDEVNAEDPDANAGIAPNEHRLLLEDSGDYTLPSHRKTDLRGFDINSTTHVTSELKEASEDGKHAAVEIENAPHGRPQASS